MQELDLEWYYYDRAEQMPLAESINQSWQNNQKN